VHTHIKKYVAFCGLCRFADFNDLSSGTLFPKPISNEIIVEIVRQQKPPLKWSADSLKKALKAEKEFNEVLLQRYEKAREAFFNDNALTSG